MYELSRGGDRPMVEQLREQLAGAIASGSLAEGVRLPSTRRLAQQLKVNRATIVEAYRRLEDERLVEQRRGSGTYVLRPHAVPAASPRLSDSTTRRPRGRAGLDPRPLPDPRPAIPPGAIDLASLAPHERHYPAAEFAECLARVMSERGGSALAYGPTLGDAKLREALAERLGRRGLEVSASNILIVGGAQQGLDLLFRSFLTPGDAVITESPTYHMALDLLRFHEARVAGVPILDAGAPGLSTLDFAALETEIERRPPTLAYVMPTFQNPTGLSLDMPSRRRLASACHAADVLLIEDDYEADMAHDGAPLSPIAALPEAGDVAYVGTLSKALFPGLRVGWVVAKPELLGRLAQVKRLSDLSGALLLQAVAAELIASGAYDRHLAEAVTSTGQRMGAMLRALEASLPEGCRVTAPRGGHVLWLEAPVESGRVLAAEALRQGVVVTAGEAFLPGPRALAAVRISIAHIDESEVEEAASRLARAVAACIEEGRSRPAFGADMERPVQV